MARTHARKDWAALKAAYRRGEGSIAQLAPKFGIAKSTAEKRCAREHWQVQRQEVGRKAEAKAVANDVETVAQMLARHRRLTSAILLKAEKLLETVPETVAGGTNAAPLGDDGETDLGEASGSSPALDLQRIAGTLARALPLERLSAGIDPRRPVKPVELTDDDEVTFDVDLPPEEEAAPAQAAAPAKP